MRRRYRPATLLECGRLPYSKEQCDLVLLLHKTAVEDHVMSNSRPNQLCSLGCQTQVPAELETEGLCVLHFLLCTERACSELRHETASGRLIAARKAHIETYVATAAMKLASVGTGTLRMSDEMKRRVLTTFLTLMILRENVDRDTSLVPRVRFPKSTGETTVVGALN
jgi:hypothetical protein